MKIANTTNKLQKLSYNLTEAKRSVLEKIAQSEKRSVAQIAKELKKTRGMIYQHLRELRDTGYIDEKFNITEAGWPCFEVVKHNYFYLIIEIYIQMIASGTAFRQ